MWLDDKKVTQIEKNITSTMSRQNVPGLGVGIVSTDGLIYGKGFGVANLEEKSPVTPNTVFRIASVSKVLTAVGVMQLVERGQIKLDRPANEYLTSFKVHPRRPTDDPITVRHLLTHTSGLGELAPLSSYLKPGSFFGLGRVGKPLKPLGEFYGNRLRGDSPPGTKWAYANHGFAALGQLIADVTGRSFADAMLDLQFEPLQMSRTDFLRRDRVMSDIAEGYNQRENQKPVWDFDIITLADGSLFTTVNDFAHFARAMINGGDEIIRSGTLSRMFKPYFQLDKRLPGMGLGYFLESRLRWGGHLIVSHDGAWLGFTSAFYAAPELGLAAYAFANTNAAAPIHIAYNIMRTLIKDDQSLFPQAAEENRAVWPDVVGTFRPTPGWNSNARLWYSYGSQFKIFINEDRLWLKARYGSWSTPVPLEAADPQDPLAFTAERVPIIFRRNAAGQVDRLLIRFHEFLRV